MRGLHRPPSFLPMAVRHVGSSIEDELPGRRFSRFGLDRSNGLRSDELTSLRRIPRDVCGQHIGCMCAVTVGDSTVTLPAGLCPKEEVVQVVVHDCQENVDSDLDADAFRS